MKRPIVFPLKSETRQGCCLCTCFQHCTGGPSQWNKASKTNIKIGREVKGSVYTNKTIVYVEIFKEPTKKPYFKKTITQKTTKLIKVMDIKSINKNQLYLYILAMKNWKEKYHL